MRLQYGSTTTSSLNVKLGGLKRWKNIFSFLVSPPTCVPLKMGKVGVVFESGCGFCMCVGRQKPAAGGGTNTNWYVSKTGNPSSTQSRRRRDYSTSTDYENVFGDICRPKGNTLLQLFGDWLFKAAIWPGENWRLVFLV